MAFLGSYLGRARFGAALGRVPLVKVIGVVDSDSRTGRSWARELPGKPTFYTSIDILLAAQPEIDGIVIGCALPDRAAAIEILVSAGIPVLTEFPYTKSLAEMDRLSNIGGATAARIIPALTHRFDSAVLKLDGVLQNRMAGSINRVQCEVSFPLSAGYALVNGVVPVSVDWYDLLQVVAARTIDLCQRWLGKPRA